jgi:hypothetical protein
VFVSSLVVVAIVAALALVCLPPVSLGAVAAVHQRHTPVQTREQRNLAAATLGFVTGVSKVRPGDGGATIGFETLGVQPYDIDELSHLQDVRVTITTAWTIGVVALALAALTGVWQVYRKRRTGPPVKAGGRLGTHSVLRSVKIAGWVCVGLPVAIAVALLVAFDWFFRLFHLVLYPQGNWQFASDSALIYSFPEPYWLMMGLLWMLFLILGGVVMLVVSGYGRRWVRRSC